MNSSNNKQIKFYSIFLVILFWGFQVTAQESAIIKGKIEAETGDLEKIHVINLNLEKGSVTDVDGNFQILANISDSLYISSVQFENKTVVVTPEMLESGSLVIVLSDKINELAEVLVDDIKLSGYLASDINKISTADVERKYRLQNDLNEFIAKDREQNPYVKPISNGGIRLDKVAGAVIDKLSEDRKTTPVYTPREIANKSLQIVGHEFFREDLELQENEICNFVYFCTEDSPTFNRLVINSNAFVLIEYFQTRIEEFRDLRGEILNTSKQIPG
ncbi:carboxypeptidase-like regulatory domain-containing protein [Christiangramia crocea]|uniref:Carboxypeptidase-like regulatory domain-containing protein n=1 Tax=Christiangramia crocea TaxID=2904124 RepID=A0A9X2A6F0_9FLAO|nr:carboxypeptidase-like regulatory domain-containing protein [Gramella crocea]MCG9972284.1 carboxypeptidase-like regulatory domain-containing protein [Gramella crocea]